MKTFFSKNWSYFAAVLLLFVITLIYFQPQIEGNLVKQYDTEQYRGMAQESKEFRELYGEEPMWTNAMFGGMPLTQISFYYAGNLAKTALDGYMNLFEGPIALLFLHLISFFILGLFLRINPWLSALGALIFGFATYEIIIIEVGHVTKSIATALMPTVIGSFIWAYRTDKKILAASLSGIFLALQLAANHLQVTYYMAFLLFGLGIYFLIQAIKQKTLKPFIITSGLLIFGFIMAVLVNLGNITLTKDYAPYTIRGGNDVTITPTGEEATNQSTGLDKDYITQWSYGIGESFNFISPNVKGGGSFPIAGSHLEDAAMNADVSSDALNFGAYWGEQPFTSGPTYLGIVAVFLALLGLVILKDSMKWPLLVVAVLAILLSWGKNFMGLTEFLIDNLPGYNKFRTVTIVLVLVELIVPLLAILTLDFLLKNKETLKERFKPMAIFSGAFFFLLVVVRITGLGDNYMSSNDQKQLESIEQSIRTQVAQADPNVLKSNYNVDVTNPASLDAFVDAQMEKYEDNFQDLRLARQAIFNDSMNRSLIFTLLIAGLILLFALAKIPTIALIIGSIVLVAVDMIPVAYDYLGSQEDESGRYKYWIPKGDFYFPIATNNADLEILKNEVANNPKLASKLDDVRKKAENEALEMELEGSARRNYVDGKVFQALNFETSYRVFEFAGGFQSSRSSYFHKGLGGNHAAKLRNINNMIEFHFSNMNNKTFDMMNVKYFIQRTEQGDVLRPNPTAMGPVWMVKTVEEYATPNEEIRALGSQFAIENTSNGQLLVNAKSETKATIYGTENMSYVVSTGDSIAIRMPNDLPVGTVAYFVQDKNGQTNYVPASTMDNDSAKVSFTPLFKLTVSNTFDVGNEAIMLTSEAKKLTSKKFSGEGTVQLKDYKPNHLKYTFDSKEKQLVVFSEVYYPDGWKLFVDGKETPILKVNYVLRGAEIPAGKHQLEMKFDIPAVHRSNTLAYAGSFILLILLGLGIWQSAKESEKKNSK